MKIARHHVSAERCKRSACTRFARDFPQLVSGSCLLGNWSRMPGKCSLDTASQLSATNEVHALESGATSKRVGAVVPGGGTNGAPPITTKSTTDPCLRGISISVGTMTQLVILMTHRLPHQCATTDGCLRSHCNTFCSHECDKNVVSKYTASK